jgi:hypothetical protein
MDGELRRMPALWVGITIGADMETIAWLVFFL